MSCNHRNEDGTKRQTWIEYDARGIPLGRVCAECKDAHLKKYRPDVLTDPNYWSDEPID